MRSLALKIFEDFWILQKFVKFIKEKVGGTIFKTLPFGAWCTNLTFFFYKLRNYKVGKVKKMCNMVAI